MPISEPSGELWSKVKPHTEWPDTNEDMMGALYFALMDSADALADLARTAATRIEIIRMAWPDQAGTEMVRTLTWELKETADIAGRLFRIGGLAGAFAVDVKNAKSYIRTIIAANTLPYEAAGHVPLIGGKAQDKIAKQVATWINNRLATLDSAIATRQNVDHKKIIEELSEGRDPLERAKDLLQDNANLVKNVSDVIGDISTILGLTGDAVGSFPHPIAKAAGEVLGYTSLGPGIVATGGHYVARAAGAEVPDETLQWDRQAVIAGALNKQYGTTGVVAAQAAAELASTGDDPNPSTFFNDLGDYWEPHGWQYAAYGSFSTPLQILVPFSNAVDDGVTKDNAGQDTRNETRARERVGAR